MLHEIPLVGMVAVRVLYFKGTICLLRRYYRFVVMAGVISGLVGCVSPIAMDHAVIGYDRAHAQIQTQLLLLNIARARNHMPIHFTAVPNVAATFDFRMNAGLAREPLRNGGGGMALALGTSVAENPTINIVPIQGEAFTKRLLTPMDESKFEFMAHQGVDIGMVLRLMVRAILIEKNGVRTIFHNDARHIKEFQQFRRAVFHLAALEYAGVLDIGPINYDRQWSISGRDPSMDELLKIAERGYFWTTEENEKIFSKPVRGRILIANFDPNTLSNFERRRLDKKARQYPNNFILVDIRPGYPGGEFPIQAWIKLRSFNAVIEFIANSMHSYPEFRVEKDPRSGTIPANPVKTLEILESSEKPKNVDFFVEYHSAYYWLADDKSRHEPDISWNQEVFKLLYHLYQMTVMDVTHVPGLPISIAK
ncbi:MAG: hypothetical protein GXP09_04295 [Gammaproteobacteria bacterium]|nr:hypothetical protein [Gammaproteobacteria bacterium]